MVSRVVCYLETKFHRLFQCFRGSTFQWSPRKHYRRFLHTEFQDGCLKQEVLAMSLKMLTFKR